MYAQTKMHIVLLLSLKNLIFENDGTFSKLKFDLKDNNSKIAKIADKQCNGMLVYGK